MKKISRTFVLASWCVLMLGLSGPGCQTPCEEQGVPLFDNRDRVVYPHVDEDWICVMKDGKPFDASIFNQPPRPPPPPPPPPPDVRGDHPADPPGPKDPDAVVKAAIILNSCYVSLNFFESRINKNISEIYFDLYRPYYAQRMFERVGCFKDKANGCDAMRECVGIFQQLNGKPEMNIAPDPVAGEACVNGTSYAHEEFFVSKGNGDVLYVTDTWTYCEGFGLKCEDDDGESYCSSGSTFECKPPTQLSDFCHEDRPLSCTGPYSDGKYYGTLGPKCSDFGLTCDTLNCMGTGPSCETPLGEAWSWDDSHYTYKAGVACDSATMLRACVGKNEALVDCTTLGQGFTCIPGEIARCGFAAECDEKTPVVCEGDSLVVCDAGRIRKVDCKSMGFTSCDAKHLTCSPGVFDNAP